MLPSAMMLLLRHSLIVLVTLGGGLAARAAGAPEPGPSVKEFPVTTVSALLRPGAVQRLTAPMGGKFQLAGRAGPVAAGDIVGRFEDTGLQTALETARLRWRAAQQQEADYLAEAPTRRQEALTRVTDLESRLALAEAVAKNPDLRRDLPAAVLAALAHADPAGLRAQLDAAKGQAARLDRPEQDEISPARLQVRDAERAVHDAEARLRESTVVAPFGGVFQANATLNGPGAAVLLGAGQEIGVLRDLTRLVAAVPALSPYLVRADLARTVLRVTGPGGRSFEAPFHEAVTEVSPVMGEARVFLYEFSAADSREIAGMVQTNVDARILLIPAEPVVVIPKLDAALKYPEAFHAGWAAGVALAWPGWTLACEGETALGLLRAKP